MQINFHSHPCSYLPRVPILVEDTVYISISIYLSIYLSLSLYIYIYIYTPLQKYWNSEANSFIFAVD